MDRRKATCMAGADVVAALPAGPSTASEMSIPRPAGPVSPPLPRRQPPAPPERGRSAQQGRGGSGGRRQPQGRGRRPSSGAGR
jgi:hypothetical protein